MIRGGGRQFTLRTGMIVVAVIAFELFIGLNVARSNVARHKDRSVLGIVQGIAIAHLPYVFLWGLIRSTFADHLVTRCVAQRRPTPTSRDDAV